MSARPERGTSTTAVVDTATSRWADRMRSHWKQVSAFVLVGAGAGTAAALLLPSYFRSEAAFQAEATSSLPQLPSGLAGLAAQFGGVSLGGGQSNPQLFADILTTDAVLRRVASGSYPWRGQLSSLAAAYGYAAEPGGWREYKTVRKLRRAINVDVNVRTSIVRFSVEARTPALAQALAESMLVALNQANIALRQARAAAEQNFTSERSEQAHGELAAAEAALAGFYQRNRVITGSPTLQMEEARLKRSVDMAQQVYVQLRLQAEQAAVQAVRNTPSISVVDPPLLPVKRSWPQGRTAVVLGALIGLALVATKLFLGQ